MAKRHKRRGQICPFCGSGGLEMVFEPPTASMMGSFKIEKHVRLPAGPAAGKTCSHSGRPLEYFAWPDWAAQLNEQAVAELAKRKR